jgi:mannonate dehydratase
MVWNMIYDQDAPDEDLPTISHDELWERLAWFLERIIPVAEESGVQLALHPDDPPLPVVRGQPRLVYQHHMYQRLLDLHVSDHNGLEFCVGTLAEMTEDDIYDCGTPTPGSARSIHPSPPRPGATLPRDVHRRRGLGR